MNVNMDENLRFHWRAGDLALDFANTVDNNYMPDEDDYVQTYDDLVAWSRLSGLLNEKEAAVLIHHAADNPAAANAALSDARQLRGALIRLFGAAEAGETLDPADLSQLNQVLGEILPRPQLSITDATLRFERRVDVTRLDGVLMPVAWAAAELLTSLNGRWLKRCMNPRCGWFFLDTSKNHSRRWCEMSACGGRDKARRYYARKRGSEG